MEMLEPILFVNYKAQLLGMSPPSKILPLLERIAKKRCVSANPKTNECKYEDALNLNKYLDFVYAKLVLREMVNNN